MKASELIAQLQAQIEAHGDLDVVIIDDEDIKHLTQVSTAHALKSDEQALWIDMYHVSQRGTQLIEVS